MPGGYAQLSLDQLMQLRKAIDELADTVITEFCVGQKEIEEEEERYRFQWLDAAIINAGGSPK